MTRFRFLCAAALLATAGLVVVAGFVVAGPDEYEMATYQVGFYRKGPNWTPGSTPELQKLQSEHLAHIGKMAETGKLINWVGVVVLPGGVLRGWHDAPSKVMSLEFRAYN